MKKFVVCFCVYGDDEQLTGTVVSPTASPSSQGLPKHALCSVPLHPVKSDTYRNLWAMSAFSLLCDNPQECAQDPLVLVVCPSRMWDLAALRSEVYLGIPLSTFFSAYQGFECKVEHVSPSALPDATLAQAFEALQTMDDRHEAFPKLFDVLLKMTHGSVGRVRNKSRRMASALLDQDRATACTHRGIKMDHAVWPYVECLWEMASGCATGTLRLKSESAPGAEGLAALWKAVPTVQWRQGEAGPMAWSFQEVCEWVQRALPESFERSFLRIFRTLCALTKVAVQEWQLDPLGPSRLLDLCLPVAPHLQTQ